MALWKRKSVHKGEIKKRVRGLSPGCCRQGFKEPREVLKNHRELKVWQEAYQLCLKIYKVTKSLLREER
jgi:hypothetical protein